MNRLLMGAALAMLPVTAAVAAAPMSPSTYVMKAGAADQYEIQSSRLLLQSSKNQRLRSFAEQMITDHSKSTATVKAAAMKAGLHPAAPMLDAMGQKNMAALRAASGSQRDALYLQQQKTAHEMALKLQRDYMLNGTSAPLKAAAAQVVPVVQHHIEELAGM